MTKWFILERGLQRHSVERQPLAVPKCESNRRSGSFKLPSEEIVPEVGKQVLFIYY